MAKDSQNKVEFSMFLLKNKKNAVAGNFRVSLFEQCQDYLYQIYTWNQNFPQRKSIQWYNADNWKTPLSYNFYWVKHHGVSD